jgi:outer membrane protein assembly factor BamE (lipoprotein component of BamABCDE complex)
MHLLVFTGQSDFLQGMHMKKVLTTVVIALAVMVTGCASVGNDSLRTETESSVQGKIVEGKTTKAQVKGMFGSPIKTTFTDGGLEVWTYEFSKVSADATTFIPIVSLFAASSSGTKKELVVMFDPSGVTKRYSMSESEVKQRTGLLNQ